MKLTTEQHQFFDQQGYIVVRGAVPPAQCGAVVDAMWEYMGRDSDDPGTWYEPSLPDGFKVKIPHHPAVWRNREEPGVHAAFASLFGTPELRVSIDDCGFKAPFDEQHRSWGDEGFVHWDLDLHDLPKEFWVQGVLCLTDTDEDMGGFQCVPGFHHDLELWLKANPDGTHYGFLENRSLLPAGREVVPIPARQGDLIIWNRRLAHGNGKNVSDKPRLSQYISMFPTSVPGQQALSDRIAGWQGSAPPAELSPLGRRLLGLDAW